MDQGFRALTEFELALYELQPEHFEFSGELEGNLLGEASRGTPRSPSGRIITVPPVVICGKPSRTIDRFRIDQSSLVRDPPKGIDHFVEIDSIADQIVQSWSTSRPIRIVCLEGHADESGPKDYNFRLGLRRAQSVKTALHNAIVRKSIKARRPDIPKQINIVTSSAGEEFPIADNVTEEGRSRNRRVEVAVPTATTLPKNGKTIPPDRNDCGVPQSLLRTLRRRTHTRPGHVKHEFEVTGSPQQVKPKLCFFQNVSAAKGLGHIINQADRWARRIKAIAEPNISNCRFRVGPTPYNTGQDILTVIDAAFRCLNQPVEEVHMFGHMGRRGIFGTTDGESQGLYHLSIDQLSRSNGGRTVSDIPFHPFAENIVFILHGCSTAVGDDNFARSLYEHLSTSIRNPKVNGHTIPACIGMDCFWREYSNRSKKGEVKLPSISPMFQDDGRSCKCPGRK